MAQFSYTFGIEEEYFLSHPNGQLVTRFPEGLLADAKARLGEAVTLELLQSQIEIASPIFHGVDEALASMRNFRTSLADVVGDLGFRLIAASTHPLGAWHEQVVTDKPRYDQMMSDFRIIGERNLVCGMHVHVAIPPHVDRVALMNRAMHWLPVFLALSASSPFWNRRVTGLMSYRQAVYDEWPRSGIPDFFDGEPDYQSFVAASQRRPDRPPQIARILDRTGAAVSDARAAHRGCLHAIRRRCRARGIVSLPDRHVGCEAGDRCTT